jgi:hypothetical protein
MECLFDIILPLLGEAFVGTLIEALAEGIGRLVSWIGRTLSGSADDPRRPADDLRVGRAILYQLFGLLMGSLSLLVFRQHLIGYPVVRILNLIVTPVLMAFLMVQWGKFLAAKHKRPTPLNHFVCAYGFALCYLLVRFFFAR